MGESQPHLESNSIRYCPNQAHFLNIEKDSHFFTSGDPYRRVCSFSSVKATLLDTEAQVRKPLVRQVQYRHISSAAVIEMQG
jgi:hypothetical protein